MGEIAPHQRSRAFFDAGRALFLSAHFNGYARQLDPDLWISLEVGDPRFDLLDHDILDYILYRMGLQLVQPSNAREWTDVSKLPPDAVDRVISASAFLERSLAGSSLPVAPTTQAIQAWCDYVRAAIRQDVAALDQAGKRFLTVERHPQHTDGDTRLQLKAADICFKAAGHQQHAEQVARVWTEQFPDDAAGWQRLAEVLTRSGAYEDAVTAYEQFARLSPATDDDWQATLLLKLGLDAKMSRALDASLRDLTATHPVRPIGEALLQWSWPPFASMSPLAQVRLIRSRGRFSYAA